MFRHVILAVINNLVRLLLTFFFVSDDRLHKNLLAHKIKEKKKRKNNEHLHQTRMTTANN